MNRHAHLVVPIIVTTFLLGGCASTNNANTGAAVGGLSGALLGSWTGADEHHSRNAILLGLIGAGVGYAVGNEMDKTDAQQVGRVLETGPSNAPVSWRNPDSGNQYTATPRPAYEYGGKVCREVEIDGWVGGRPEVVEATACRQPNGNWVLAEGGQSGRGHGDRVARHQPPPRW
ncbi:MAG: hypothetical protein H6981_09700 [Gammaproteobacteria bacterium]|nr:hypothetical protein [Gammaproteobacteria bacterium]MCP5137061.1 hypothetical protein [Gammaproteobacteria bacterium]